jgi:hypothetical protein
MRPVRLVFLLSVASSLVLAISACTKTTEDYAAEVDRNAERDVVLKTLQETDTTFYGQIRDRAAGRLAAGESEAEVLEAMQAEMRAYGLRQAPYVAAAPGGAVVEVMQAEKALIEHLQATDVDTCAQFAMAGLPAGYQADARTKPLIDRAATARLVAGQSGRASPVTREDPGQADFVAVYETMVAGGVDEALGQQFFGTGLMSAPPRTQCDVTAAFYSAVVAQPPARAEAVSAFIIKTVAKQMAPAGG